MKPLQSIFIAIVLLCSATSCSSQGKTTQVSADAFQQGISQPDVQLLDVRTPGEYQSGHLSNTLQADWNNQAVFLERIKALDKSKPVYVYCLGGGRSAEACNYLSEQGFVTYNLAGGITAWKKADKPVEKAVAVPQIPLSQFMESIPADKTVLVDFGAEWCPPCRKMAPVLDSLQAAIPGKFQLVKVDGAAQTDLCKAFQVEAFPVFIVFKAGKEVWRRQGLVSLAELQQQLQ